jgi:hypothetical protein
MIPAGRPAGKSDYCAMGREIAITKVGQKYNHENTKTRKQRSDSVENHSFDRQERGIEVQQEADVKL